MRRLLLLLALLGSVLVAPASAEAPLSLERDVLGHEDCDQLVPELPGAATGERVDLDVLVLAERADLPVVRQITAVAAQTYARLGIRLVPRFRVSRPVPDFEGDSAQYLGWLKEQVGGLRPRGIDVVYLATSHDLLGAGLADCIGGIARADHAFAVGMLTFDGAVGVDIRPSPGLPEPPLAEGGGKLMAHEIGHLLGAHHHYGYHCALTPDAGDPTHPCDVMFTVPKALLGKHFGLVNAAVVRDQAQRFA